MPHWTLQYDPSSYSDPEAFKPERWLEGGELGGDESNYTDFYVPFSAGSRSR